MKKYSYAICACARMEENNILEWLTYHQIIGVEKFYIYGNDDDCRVLGDVLLPIMNNSDLVTFVHYRAVGAQRNMYIHFLQHFAHLSKWVSFIDLDEFIGLNAYKDLLELTSSVSSEFASIQLNWLNYGPSNFIERPLGSVLRNYKFRTKFLDIHTKHITKTEEFYKHGVSGPFWHSLDSSKVNTCNILGDKISFWNSINDFEEREIYKQYLMLNNEKIINMACIYHFVLKSENDFKRRVERSIQGDFNNQLMYRKYIEDPSAATQYISSLNEVYDDSLSNFWDAQLAKKYGDKFYIV